MLIVVMDAMCSGCRAAAARMSVSYTHLHDLTQELRDADLLICFGGDGTILHASKAATRAGVPILGVNIGTMGFIDVYKRQFSNRIFSLDKKIYHHG